MAFFEKMPLLNRLPRSMGILLIILLTTICCCLAIFSSASLIPKSNSISSSLPIPSVITGILQVQPTQSPIPTLSGAAASLTPAAEGFPTTTFMPIAKMNLPACIHDITPEYALVTKVVDGDTIHVLLNGVEYKVRYIGMDTPESTIQHDPGGVEASNKNKELVTGRNVILFQDVSETDQFGRLLRYVFVGSSFINQQLVTQGFASAKEYRPDTACAALFAQAEIDARAKGAGFLWAGSTAQPTPGSKSASLTILTVNKSAEYVDLKNISSAAINLTGWRLLSEKGSQSCDLTGTLAPGQTLRVWSQSGQGGLSCHFPDPIWNNLSSDPAVLFNPQAQEVDRK